MAPTRESSAPAKKAEGMRTRHANSRAKITLPTRTTSSVTPKVRVQIVAGRDSLIIPLELLSQHDQEHVSLKLDEVNGAEVAPLMPSQDLEPRPEPQPKPEYTLRVKKMCSGRTMICIKPKVQPDGPRTKTRITMHNGVRRTRVITYLPDIVCEE